MTQLVHADRPPSPALPRTSLLLLVAANALPLLGVAALGWRPIDLLLLYWLESAVLGIWNVARLALAPLRAGAARQPGPLARLPLVLFFCLHYGGFLFVHLMFLMILCGGDRLGAGDPGRALQFLRGALGEPAIRLAALGFAVSHGYSFFANYLGRREYARTTVQRLMVGVYGRVFAMHVAIVLGAAGVHLLGLPAAVLVVLVLGKIALDARAHRREHRVGGQAYR